MERPAPTSPLSPGPGWAAGLALASLLCASGCAMTASRASDAASIAFGLAALLAAATALVALAVDAGAIALALGEVRRGRYLTARYAAGELPARLGPGLRFGPGLRVRALRAWGVPDLDVFP